MNIQDISSHLMQLEKERCAAMVRGDRERLRELLHPELLHVHAKGQVDNFESYFAEGGFKVDYTRVDRSDLSVRVLGDEAALMTGRQVLEAVRKATGERIFIDSRVMQVWKRVEERWQQLAFQTTAMEMTVQPPPGHKAPGPRRVVTGHDPTGKSSVLFDGPVGPQPTAQDRFVWTTEASPADTGKEDAAPRPHRLEPPRNGSIYRLLEVRPAGAGASLSGEEMNAAVRKAFAAMGASHCLVDTSRAPNMHRTASVDYVVVLRGEVTLTLDTTEVDLKPGDLVVQQATNHAWSVRGNQAALLGVVMLDAGVAA